jgi:HEPN domain-containing protein
MTSDSLAHSLIHQARRRLLLVETARNAGDHHIAVREAQEVVELALKGMLRAVGCEPAKVHDVSRDMLSVRTLLEESGVKSIDALVNASKKLRKERENSFYGDVDMLPEEYYGDDDSHQALAAANLCVDQAELLLSSVSK